MHEPGSEIEAVDHICDLGVQLRPDGAGVLELSQPELASRAAPEDVGLANVAAGHLSAGMAELGLDGALVAVVHRDRGGVTAAQAVAGVTGGVKPCGFGGALDDQGHRAVAQAVQPNGASATDRAEQRQVLTSQTCCD
jgi:hypothetical protein